MNSVLESVEWGKPILKIISHCKDLDPNLPTVLHIRHTERPMREPGNAEEYTLLSTEQGNKASYQLGTLLPKDRKYRLYHTQYERTKETASEIQRGIQSNNVKAETIGPISLSTVVNRPKFYETGRKESANGLSFIDMSKRWLSNHYPPWVRVPSHVFAQRGAAVMMDNLENAGASSFDVYVSHDVFIAAFLFHWFGFYPSDWVMFLEGFILQLTEDKMIVYTKERKKELYYPYWWNFQQSSIE